MSHAAWTRREPASACTGADSARMGSESEGQAKVGRTTTAQRRRLRESLRSHTARDNLRRRGRIRQARRPLVGGCLRRLPAPLATLPAGTAVRRPLWRCVGTGVGTLSAARRRRRPARRGRLGLDGGPAGVPGIDVLQPRHRHLRPARIAEPRHGSARRIPLASIAERVKRGIVLQKEFLRQRPRPAVDGDLLARHEEQVEASQCLLGPARREGIPGPGYGPKPRDGGAMSTHARPKLEVLPRGRRRAREGPRIERGRQLRGDMRRKVARLCG